MGGILYKKYGGVLSLKIFSMIALTTGVIYLILYLIYLKNAMTENGEIYFWIIPYSFTYLKFCFRQEK